MKTYMLIKIPNLGSIPWTKRENHLRQQAKAFSIIVESRVDCIEHRKFVSKQATRYELYNLDEEVLSLVHIRNHIKGAKLSLIWACEGKIDTDKHIIKSLGTAYCGIMDRSNFEQIKQFGVYKTKLNSLIKIEKLMLKLENFDKEERHNIAMIVKARIDEVNLELGKIPQNLIKRGF
jgi:hypothetical protein